MIDSSKPISNILSASSKIKVWILSIFKCPRSIISITLPGVPTIISHPFFNLLIWSSIDTPPYINTVLKNKFFEDKSLYSRPVWIDNSLVGANTNILGWVWFNSFLSIYLINVGKTKANVFPLPVNEETITFLPEYTGI